MSQLLEFSHKDDEAAVASMRHVVKETASEMKGEREILDKETNYKRERNRNFRAERREHLKIYKILGWALRKEFSHGELRGSHYSGFFVSYFVFCGNCSSLPGASQHAVHLLYLVEERVH